LVLVREWTDNGPILHRYWPDEVEEKRG
jgi:hypothetical protein